MRRMTLVVMTTSLIAAGFGILAMLTHVAADPRQDSTDKPAIAAVSPLEIMKARGKDLPPATHADPF
jgi:hypothetical protein